MKISLQTNPSTLTLTKKQSYLLGGAGFLILVVLFSIIPLPGGDDWDFYRTAVQRVLAGQPLYGERIGANNHLFYYPAWLTVLLLIPGVLPFQWGWGLICALNFVVALLVARRLKLSLLKQVMVLLSPPMLYIWLHGQIDAIVLGIILLPESWRLIGCITKPQVSLAFVFGIRRKYWLKAVLIAAAVTLLSLLIFGLWPLDLIRQPRYFQDLGLNIWGGLWPFQLPLGLALVFRAMRGVNPLKNYDEANKVDDRFLIAASPFFMSYAATSSLIGPWIALCSLLEDWQVVVVLVAWWAASISRLVF